MSRAEPSSNTERRRVLVVDDNRGSADSLAALLRISGYEAHARYDGASAVAAAEELRPHLIILDLSMPVMNGYDACRTIRAQSWSEGMAIIALTGWGVDADMPRTDASGFDARVLKPAKLQDLLQVWANLLQ